MAKVGEGRTGKELRSAGNVYRGRSHGRELAGSLSADTEGCCFRMGDQELSF